MALGGTEEDPGPAPDRPDRLCNPHLGPCCQDPLAKAYCTLPAASSQQPAAPSSFSNPVLNFDKPPFQPPRAAPASGNALRHQYPASNPSTALRPGRNSNHTEKGEVNHHRAHNLGRESAANIICAVSCVLGSQAQASPVPSRDSRRRRAAGSRGPSPWSRERG